MQPFTRIRSWWQRRKLIRRWGTADPGQIRTLQQRRWQQQVHDACGRWARAVDDVTADDWRNAMAAHTHEGSRNG